MPNNSDLTVGSVKKHLFNLTWPMTFGILAILSTSLVDTYFVGQLGTVQLAALSFTFPVVLAVNSISIGLGVGASSVVSRVFGNKDFLKAKRIATHTLILSLLIIVSLSLLGYFTVRPLFSLIGAKGEALNYIETYMQVWFLSLPMLVVPMVSGAIIRATGDSFWPSFQMVLSAIVNIIATPLLMFGTDYTPAFGFEGAALGTTVAWFTTLLFGIWLVVFDRKLILFKLPKLNIMMDSWKEVLRVGLPSAVSQTIHPIAIAVVTSLLASFGEVTVAAFGVATRIESVMLIPLFALSSGIPPIAGQNFGANQFLRILETLRTSYIFCIFWGLFASFLIFIFGQQIMSIFSDNSQVNEIALTYIQILILTTMAYGFVMSASSVFNAINQPMVSLTYSVSRSLLFYIPFSYLALQFNNQKAIFYAIGAANVLAGLLALSVSRYKLKQYCDRRLKLKTHNEQR